MEMERIINFLLQGARDQGTENLGVLPIVGPANIGKSTLIEHACIDERACNHFSQIVLLGGGDLIGKDMEALADGAGVIKHKNRAESGGGRVLIIVELDRDISEDFWRRFSSAVKNRFASGSKIIVTSQSDKIVRSGTTLPLRLQFLTQEAYWYFFKVRTFGNVDTVMEHPVDFAQELSISLA
ncbi:disease resistance protein RGA2-like [Setaria viridis]|uniref:disease resistance protein RGA2-like n=1 Tax=Setaria viridis TaxID=4556 RepID=UPI003B3A363C